MVYNKFIWGIYFVVVDDVAEDEIAVEGFL